VLETREKDGREKGSVVEGCYLNSRKRVRQRQFLCGDTYKYCSDLFSPIIAQCPRGITGPLCSWEI
jgi:hypothetical protein